VALFLYVACEWLCMCVCHKVWWKMVITRIHTTMLYTQQTSLRQWIASCLKQRSAFASPCAHMSSDILEEVICSYQYCKLLCCSPGNVSYCEVMWRISRDEKNLDVKYVFDVTKCVYCRNWQRWLKTDDTWNCFKCQCPGLPELVIPKCQKKPLEQYGVAYITGQMPYWCIEFWSLLIQYWKMAVKMERKITAATTTATNWLLSNQPIFYVKLRNMSHLS